MSENREDRIFKKLDDLDTKFGNIDKTLSQQKVVLDEHIRRTELIETELKPIKDHVALVGAIGKIFAFVGAIVALALAVKQLFM